MAKTFEAHKSKRLFVEDLNSLVRTAATLPVSLDDIYVTVQMIELNRPRGLQNEWDSLRETPSGR